MPVKMALGLVLIVVVYAVLTKPFKSMELAKEFANHLLIALLTYYGTHAILYFLDFERTKAIPVAAFVTAVVLAGVNMFSRPRSSGK